MLLIEIEDTICHDNASCSSQQRVLLFCLRKLIDGPSEFEKVDCLVGLLSCVFGAGRERLCCQQFFAGWREATRSTSFGRIPRQINCVDDVSLVLSEP